MWRDMCCRMAKEHPDEYNFVPRTWILPGEHGQLLLHDREIKKRGQKRMYIVKPANGAMGNGYAR